MVKHPSGELVLQARISSLDDFELAGYLVARFAQGDFDPLVVR